MDSEWLKLIVAVLSGLVATIPLAYQLVKYVRKAIKEKNWSKLLELVMSYMERAEYMFENGADRREWVIAMVQASAESIDYDIDVDEIGELIDSLCNMSKLVNPPENNDIDIELG